MSWIKNYESFVNEQVEDFYDDFEKSQMNIKLFTTFTKSKLVHKPTELNVEAPKKKFQPKVKTMTKKSDKGIF